MADITSSLKIAMQMSGAVAIALVDLDSGMTLGTLGGESFNIEGAAAANTEVVRAKLNALRLLELNNEEIEDILITLTTQYHLIRIYKLGSHQMFLYLALEKTKANLALSRIKLSEIGKNLKV